MFESHRRRLGALAYRMLGSRAEADDVVQDTWLRWQGVEPQGISQPGAFLTRIATHLCLDRLQSARARRERYVGLWLPEPLIDGACADYSPGPDATLARAQDLSLAFLLALQRLSPPERAAFLLHDVFDVAFEEIGETLQRSAAACRQLASRARRRVAAQPGASPAGEAPDAARAQALLAAFAVAVTQGDVQGLTALLTDDVRLYSDGGGQVCAVPRPLGGPARVAQTLVGFAGTWQARGGAHPQAAVRPARINGMPGAVFFDARGQVEQVLALDLSPQGRVRGVYFQRNPDKLRGAAPLSA